MANSPLNPDEQSVPPERPPGHTVEHMAELVARYASACIRISFWLLAAAVALCLAFGVGLIAYRTVLRCVRLITEALGI